MAKSISLISIDSNISLTAPPTKKKFSICWIKLSLNTLSDKATLIPKINLKKINKIIGKNTITAVRSGFFWGYSGLIDNIIGLIKSENKKNFNTIITGGLSNLFKSSIKTKVKQNQDITVKGLIKISRLIN